MFSLGATNFQPQWQTQLSEYIRDLAWSKDGVLAIATAAGEVALWNGDLIYLQSANDYAVDCLGFSADGSWLAAAGQSGNVCIWNSNNWQSSITLQHSPQWIDRLQWHPKLDLLAYSDGRCVYIWQASNREQIAQLDFQGLILDLAWRKDGEYLAVAGNGGVKIWSSDWQQPPLTFPTPAASTRIGWSADGEYLASASLDRLLWIWQGKNPNPWKLRGFTSKIRNLVWSDIPPELIVSSGSAIAIWQPQGEGWQPTLLDLHEDTVLAIAPQPGGNLLASAANDGYLCWWQDGGVVQVTEAMPEMTCLAWQHQGKLLAVGSSQGKVMVLQQLKKSKPPPQTLDR